ncbi:MAG: response regulator [Candidatus Hydrogenedentes bacterium]|nr:response regulator [Candidatus Hydrogenedentota bacterium]
MSKNQKKVEVWIVEDEIDLSEMLALSLRNNGCEVIEFSNSEKFLEVFELRKPPNVVITDIRFPFGPNGRDLLKAIKSKDVFSPSVIIVTAYEDYPIETLYNEGAESIFIKPFDLQEIGFTVNRLALPLRERITTEPTEFFQHFSSSKIVNNCDVGDYMFGRGGMCIKTNQRLFMNEIVNFTISIRELDNINVEVIGIVRWENIYSQIPEYGIEIIKLTPPDPYLELVEKTHPLAYIPNITINS